MTYKKQVLPQNKRARARILNVPVPLPVPENRQKGCYTSQRVWSAKLLFSFDLSVKSES